VDPVDSERVKELLAQAARLPQRERRAFIEQSAGDNAAVKAEAIELLATLDDDQFLRSPTGAGVAVRVDVGAPPIERAGTRIGRYKLLQRIGEGGFGTVFMAEQTEPVVRRVALKIIKAGMDTAQVIARFEAERQALAMMDHPNIARVLDGGTTELGRPYFVMELVKGEPVTAYCDRQFLPVRQRLELFRDICGAVQHAHQKGIIHRDLKPTNVLVTVADGRPLPKVIDFGIAKATAVRLTEKTLFTELHQLIGTPEYMSPEQAEVSGIDIDTRSDVYSLGVLLYELLAGGPPFDPRRLRSAPLAEMQRIIRDEEPQRPSLRFRAQSSMLVVQMEAGSPSSDSSAVDIAKRRRTEPLTLERSLRGDLDWIVMKCIEKDRRRRYDTASALSDDIGRYLAKQPVSATPPSRSYKVRKFVVRNRGAVLMGIAIAATLLLATGVSIVFALRASRALTAEARHRAAAEKSAEETREVARFQSALLSGIDVPEMGKGIKRAMRAQVAEALSRPEAARGLATSRPTTQDAESELAAYDEIVAGVEPVDVARRVLNAYVLGDAAGKIAKEFADQPRVQVELLQTLGAVAHSLGLFGEAEPALRRAVELGEGDPASEDTVAQALSELGGVMSDTGRSAEAEQMHRRALAICRRHLGENDPEVINAMNNIAVTLAAQGKQSEAEAMVVDSLARARRLPAASRKTLANTLGLLAAMSFRRADYAAAEPLLRESLEIRRQLGDDQREQLASGLGNLASLRLALGDYAEADRLFRETLDMQRAVLGDEHPDIAVTMRSLAMARRRMGDRAGAEKLYLDALDRFKKQLGPAHPQVANVLNDLGILYKNGGDFARSEAMMREALEIMTSTHGKDHPEVALSEANLASNIRAQGRAAEAEPLFREALRVYQGKLPEGHPWRSGASIGLARSLIMLGKTDEAERLLLKEEPFIDRWPKVDRTRVGLMEGLIELYEAKDRAMPDADNSAKAAMWRGKLLAWRATTRPADSTQRVETGRSGDQTRRAPNPEKRESGGDE